MRRYWYIVWRRTLDTEVLFYKALDRNPIDWLAENLTLYYAEERNDRHRDGPIVIINQFTAEQYTRLESLQ